MGEDRSGAAAIARVDGVVVEFHGDVVDRGTSHGVKGFLEEMVFRPLHVELENVYFLVPELFLRTKSASSIAPSRPA